MSVCKERFKVAVLALCADEGLSLDETLATVKAALLEGGGKALGEAAGQVFSKGLLAAALAPAALGAVGGWGTARLTQGMNDKTPDEIKHQEMVDALRKHTEHARIQTAIAQKRKERESQRGRMLL
jgi:hypothetical protein